MKGLNDEVQGMKYEGMTTAVAAIAWGLVRRYWAFIIPWCFGILNSLL